VRRKIFCAIVVCALLPATARAWEAMTTHAGLAEEAALKSALHQTLQERFDLQSGLYAPLRVDGKADASLLDTMRRLLSPSLGYAPDARHSMSAIGWLVAGSVLADQPDENASHHFLNPRTCRGLPGRPSALDWLRQGANQNSLPALHRHLEAAVSEPAPRDRERHLALALFAAGDILHLLTDMGSPSHVRDDLRAHEEPLAIDARDRGSRFERIAALAYSRLGIPAAAPATRQDTVMSYFSNRKGTGLADQIYANWFSQFTLPASIPIASETAALGHSLRNSLRQPFPGPDVRWDLTDKKLRSQSGVCLTDLYADGKKYEFTIGDACALEQLAAILPTVAGTGAAYLDTVLGGKLAVRAKTDGIVVSSYRAYSGRLTLFWDDKDGNRTRYIVKALTKATETTAPLPPAGAVSVTALVDTKINDERALAIGRLVLPR
jgi:hypothetical protein